MTTKQGKTSIAGLINLGQAVENYQQINVSQVEVDQIVLIPGHNPRGAALGEQAFQGPEYQDLKQSIAELGDVFQPVLLRPKANSNMYELVAGERRLRIVRELGLPRISAVIRTLNDDQAYKLARQENALRAPVAKIDQLFSSMNQLAQRLGLSASAVRGVLIRARDLQAQGKAAEDGTPEALALRLIEELHLPKIGTLVRSARLLDLNADERQALREGLAEGAALALLDLQDHPRRAALLQQAMAEGWSARRMETEVKDLLSGGAPRPQIGSLLTQTQKVLSGARVRKLSQRQQQQVEEALSALVEQLRKIVAD
ncbi:ParB/RepB/Spo0J family partition protein (plasmid) [Deinococcus sp. KNUC1210]|uniref:ParB/RepB/Spo0J family partition protein n=1 Tax=Deinococcus sp. KNUC1210 TaxID=2917691 RepID=UPI001EF0A485|nr:ParB/RepB/Spo0J family partition protein [Deinococcus sp. KNUC1210]ULH17508.1 ParB/RepB/Spo0J family partition protein [Deinococcus sp. KNUC1210]